MTRTDSRRLWAAAAVIVGMSSIAAVQPAPGYTYRIRLNTATNTEALMAAFGAMGAGGGGGGGGGGNVSVTRSVGGGGGGAAAMMGGGVGNTFVLARGSVVGDLGRIDVTSTSVPAGGGGAGGLGGGGDRRAVVMSAAGGGMGGGAFNMLGGGAASLQDQHFLFLDTNRVVTLNDVTRTYLQSETADALQGVAPFAGGRGRGAAMDRRVLDSAVAALTARRDSGGGGRGRDSAVAGRTTAGTNAMREMIAGRTTTEVPITGAEVQFEQLAAQPGDTIEGYPTRHYRITSQYTSTPTGDPITLTTTVDIWAADLPFKVINPFDQTINTNPAADTYRLLQLKEQAARRKVQGTPLKIVAVSPLAAMGRGMLMRGGQGAGASAMQQALASATTTQTLTVYNIKAGDVDEALFRIPDGFTDASVRRPGG